MSACFLENSETKWHAYNVTLWKECGHKRQVETTTWSWKMNPFPWCTLHYLCCHYLFAFDVKKAQWTAWSSHLYLMDVVYACVCAPTCTGEGHQKGSSRVQRSAERNIHQCLCHLSTKTHSDTLNSWQALSHWCILWVEDLLQLIVYWINKEVVFHFF